MSSDPLNLDHLLGKAKERITLIGIELEGGWTDLPPGTNLVRDGSVVGVELPSTQPISIGSGRDPGMSRLRRLAQEPGQVKPLMLGEIPSPVMPPSELKAWMTKFYPQAVNHTCGLHVHMSFESALHYQRLMVPSYQSTILSYVTAWAKGEKLKDSHPIWPRLKGESIYCQHQFWPDLQIRTRGKDHDQRRPGHRYTALNFCYLTHGTVECRLLPMMETADQGIRVVQLILDITNAFLVKDKDQRRKEKPLKANMVIADDPYNETKRVVLSEERHSTERG